MLYSKGFWCVEDGVRLPMRTYPSTRGFEYGALDPADTTGDCGEFLLRNWCFDYTVPGTQTTLRITIKGHPCPILRKNAFDFDWASIPRLLRGLTCDKADYRVRAGCLPHDIGFCVHEFWPDMGLAFWNRMLVEIMEAYSVTWEEVGAASGVKAKAKMLARYLGDKTLRNAVWLAVTVGGPFVWRKTPEEIAIYEKMLHVEIVAA